MSATWIAASLAVSLAVSLAISGCVSSAGETQGTTIGPAATPAVPSDPAVPLPGTTTTPPAPASPASPAPSSTTAATTSSTSVSSPIRADACPPTGESIWQIRPAADLPVPELPAGWDVRTIGTSVLGRPIEAWVRDVAAPSHRVVVIGGIHGNEPASPPAVRGLALARIPDDIAVWLVPEANPDGVAAGTRCNAVGVDLNRNFDWGWRPDDGGPAPRSEPETQALTDLIGEIAPDLVVWMHQPYGYVSSIGDTDDSFEQAWSAQSGLPVRPDVTQHGGGESWTALAAGDAAMLVEIDTWDATEAIVLAQRAGFEAVVASLD